MKMTRHEALKTIVLPALTSLLASAAVATAEAKTAKSVVKYQNNPKGSQKCAGCKFFIAGKSRSAAGSCKIVDGAISPNGWCTAYTAK
jgi:hypothetical protein